MASNSNSSKSLNSPKLLSSGPPFISQANSPATGDSAGQRRGGGSGSFGAGSYSRPVATPRNSQSRKQPKSGLKKLRYDEDAFAEISAMQSTSNKRGQTSITHLMNFSRPTRPHYGHHSQAPRQSRRQGSSWASHSAISKEKYVNANYRFVVDPRFDYHANAVDADEFLDWTQILQILVSAQSQSASCPICLDTPVAPRMAKCGHIFCLSCVIRYMNSEDENNRSLHDRRARAKKCPLCWDMMYVTDLKPVRWYEGQEQAQPREGGDVVLRLVKRTVGITNALPRDGAEALVAGGDVPWYFAAEVMDYARIMKGTEDYMGEQYDNDIATVQHQEKEDEVMFGDDSAEWTRRALRSLRESKEKLKGIGGSTAEQESQSTTPASELKTVGKSAAKSLTSQATLGSGSSLHASSTANTSAASQSSSEFYFYQALLHYYLSPLDIRILKEAFGAFASFPATILPRVERVSTGHVVDDELRKRCKWLGHLPRGCEVCFLECDWADTVPEEILERFKPEIEKRRKKNEEKEAKEERARVKAEREEDEKRYAHIRRRPTEETTPSWYREGDFQPLVPASEESSEENTTSTSPPWGDRPHQLPFESLANMSTSPSTSRTVWGTRALASSSPTGDPGRGPVNDGWLQDWEGDILNEEDALVAQAQALSMSGGESSSSKAPSATQSGKKKKARKITLMSTNARRGA